MSSLWVYAQASRVLPLPFPSESLCGGLSLVSTLGRLTLSVSELPVEFCCMLEGRVDSEQKTIKWWGRDWIGELVAMWTGHYPSTRSVVWGIEGWCIEKPL